MKAVCRREDFELSDFVQKLFTLKAFFVEICLNKLPLHRNQPCQSAVQRDA
nr:MAG TPA: hypothetical protein [Caudoviricetes sp.]